MFVFLKWNAMNFTFFSTFWFKMYVFWVNLGQKHAFLAVFTGFLVNFTFFKQI